MNEGEQYSMFIEWKNNILEQLKEEKGRDWEKENKVLSLKAANAASQQKD